MGDSGASWLGLVELVLVFALVFGWGLHELRQLRRHRDAETRAGRGADAPETDETTDATAGHGAGREDDPPG